VLELVTNDFDAALEMLRGAGLRLDVIYPADDPQTAILSRDGRSLRLTARADAPEIPETMPPFAPRFLVTRAGVIPGQGRAGMLYRDLIPGRLGGRYIASHIVICQGGPVSDWVHYHRVALQMIYVRRGWVRVVYEDQGEPFVMNPGDLVLQPPLIRHRVLESSAGLEVVELGCPALHETFAEHELTLPNAQPTARDFGGQRFLRHVGDETRWTPFDGVEAQETAMSDATAGLAAVRTIRAGDASAVDFDPHDGELGFGFVLDGRASLDHAGIHALEPADAFVIPPGEAWGLGNMSDDFRLLHVTTGRLRD
jgi:quercetin dioxygenase-like cupin family protein